MREIKFRAWNRRHGMSDPNECFEPINGMWNFQGSPAKDFDYLDFTIMQYTGLKDKNGREIYEGDIVIWEINEGSDGYPNIVRGLYVVSWCEKEGLWIFRDPHSGETWKMFDTEFDEIIGNVHENPELVEPKGGGR